MEEKKLRVIVSQTLRGAISEANSKEVTKDDIVSIQNIRDLVYIVYFK